MGRKTLTLREARSLKVQDVIELAKVAGESFDVRINGRVFAQGEVVVVTERVSVRLTSLAEPRQEVPR